MSEESKITSVVKTKDPRRVEAGKRLGMISKQAKERKALREREASAAEVKEENDDWFSNCTTPILKNIKAKPQAQTMLSPQHQILKIVLERKT